MPSEARLRRTGHHLTWLASLGQLGCVAVWIGHLISLQLLPKTGVVRGLTPFEAGLLAAIATAGLLSQLWPLTCLRRIGRLLDQGVTVNRDMAAAWKRLGHALVLATVVLFLPVSPVRGPQGSLNIQLALGGNGFYGLLVAILCVFAIARLLDEAAGYRDENAGFV